MRTLVVVASTLAVVVATGCERARGVPDSTQPTIEVRAVDGRAECHVTGGEVFGRGDGSRGLLGTGTAIEDDDRFRRIEPLRNVTALDIAKFATFACAVAKGEVWCWGDNVAGTLGRVDAPLYDGSTDSISKPRRVEGVPESRMVVLGLVHACSLGRSGSVHCWGLNAAGEVIDPRREPRFAVTPPVEVPVPRRTDDLFLSPVQSCALTAGGEVHCWGGSVPGPTGPSPAFVPTLVARDALERPRDPDGGGRSCVKTKGGEVCWDYAVDEVLRLYQEPHLARQK